MAEEGRGVLPPSPQEQIGYLAPSSPAPPARALSQGGDTNFYFWNANKQMMAELRSSDLRLIFETLVLPQLSTPPSIEGADKWSDDRLRKLIQAEASYLFTPSFILHVHLSFTPSVVALGLPTPVEISKQRRQSRSTKQRLLVVTRSKQLDGISNS